MVGIKATAIMSIANKNQQIESMKHLRGGAALNCAYFRISSILYLFCTIWIGILALAIMPAVLLAHGIADHELTLIQGLSGLDLFIFAYLGAKHMVTGYDHLLFLFGVIFFLYRLRDVGIYATLFAVGHSLTLIISVLTDLQINGHLADAAIGISVVYKALDNLKAFQRWFGFQPNAKSAVLIFGFFHGFGLAAKLEKFSLPEDALVSNLIAFNLGVEIGQFLLLGALLIFMSYWRGSPSFAKRTFATNTLLMSMGFLLVSYHLIGYIAS